MAARKRILCPPDGHVCAACTYHWRCADAVLGGKSCEVEKAAKVNKQGPFCALCRALFEAEHFAMLRKLNIRVVVAAFPWEGR